MAKKTYDGTINKHTEWGGDASTGNLPVAGSSVQRFIKDSLDSKFGKLYLDTERSLYLCFSDEEDYNKYLETGDITLIRDSFVAISNYATEVINTTSDLCVLTSTTNNLFSYKYKIYNKNSGLLTGEKVKAEYSFNNAGTLLSFTDEFYPEDVDTDGYAHKSVLIDNYIKTGINNITVKITGLDTNSIGQVTINFEVLDLSYLPTFDYANTWQSTDNIIKVQYTITCSKKKWIEWYLDGKKCANDTEISEASTTYGDTFAYNVSSLSAGMHTFQTRAYVTTNDSRKFYTESHFYMFAIKGGESPCVPMYKVNNDGSIVNSASTLSINCPQFELIQFEWGYYDPLQRTLNVDFYYDDKKVSSISKSNGSGTETFTYRPTTINSAATITIKVNNEYGFVDYSYVISVNVTKSNTAFVETTGGMILKLSAMNRSNDEAETKNVWEYYSESEGKTYSTVFSGFSWNSLQGWSNNALVISDGAFIEVNIKPMVNDWTVNGGTVEIDIETFDVEDENATIMECSDGLEDSAYIKITATSAKIKPTGNADPLETRFKDNDRMKLCFICNPVGTLEDSNLIYIVNNGVLERSVYYNNTTMSSDSPLKIGDLDGNGKVKCRIRSIRVYNHAITVDNAFMNYAIDSDNLQSIYEQNNVFKEGSTTEVDYDKIVSKIPVLTFTGDLPAIMKKADKTAFFFDVEYTNMADPTRNFTAFHVQTKLQGTSSLGYPRKNYKIKTKNKDFTPESYASSNYYFDNDTRRLYNKTTLQEVVYTALTQCMTFNYKGNAVKNGKLRIKDDYCQKVNCWTLKADYMESSCSHNTGAAKMWNDIFKNVLLNNTNTYIDSAIEATAKTGTYERKGVIYTMDESKIANQKGYLCRTQAQKIAEAYNAGPVRTAIDGFPIVCFYRLTHDSPLVFMGQYNFNNDKSTEELFGFEDIENQNASGQVISTVFDHNDVECWEGLMNTHPIGLFKNTTNFDNEYLNMFESRYPDPDDRDESGNPLYTKTNIKLLCEWVVSTRHEPDNIGSIVSSNTITINSDFAKKINKYQYGYPVDREESEIPQSFKYAEKGVYPDTPENRQKKFETEKWEHFDMWKVAGYYIFLMRYGAVDQFVKNTMLTTEGIGKFGGNYKKWYFINYDNDCLFGLRNNGRLAFDYTLNRQTIDPNFDPSEYTPEQIEEGVVAYAMMGHDSALWNNLERDEEFMRMVRALDNAMQDVGLNYDNFLNIFDKQQTDKWCERIYNANERYKYIYPLKGIGDASETIVDNLWMLQGTRKAHRHWWLANHLEYYDAKWISGDYQNKFLEMKADGKSGSTINIVAGADFYYAWGNNSTLLESNVVLSAGTAYSFVSPIDQVTGDPIRIYAVNKIRDLDVSAYATGITDMKFATISTATTHELRKLIMGSSAKNNSLTTMSLANIPNIEYLDIRNYNKLTTLDIDNATKLNTLIATGTSLQSFSPADGAKFNKVEIPGGAIQTLRLSNVTLRNLTAEVFNYTPTTALRTLYLKNNAGISDEYYNKFVRPWLNALADSVNSEKYYKLCSMDLNNINWHFNTLADVYVFEPFKAKCKSFSIKGVIDLRSCGNLQRSDLIRLNNLFPGCFSQYNDIRVITPTSIFIEHSGDTFCVAGKTAVFSHTIYPERPATCTINYYTVVETQLTPEESDDVIHDYATGKNFLPIDPSTVRPNTTLTMRQLLGGEEFAELESQETVRNTDSKFTILVKLETPDTLTYKVSYMDFTLLDPTYASKATIDGEKCVYKDLEEHNVYTLNPLTSTNKEPIGTYTVTWNMSGNGLQYVDVANSGMDPNDKNKFNLYVNDQPAISAELKLTATINSLNGSIVTTAYTILILNETVIMTNVSNPVAMGVCYAQGWSQGDANAMTKAQAEAVTSIGTAFANSRPKFTFNELKWFTSLTTIESGAFESSYIESITLPSNVTQLRSGAFKGCSYLHTVSGLSDGITEIPDSCFLNCSALKEFVCPSGVTKIDNMAFGGTGIKKVVLTTAIDKTNALVVSDALRTIEPYAFERNQSWSDSDNSNLLTIFSIPKNLTMTGNDFIVLRSKYLREIIVDANNNAYKAIDGVLYDNAEETIIRYPSQKDVEDVYQMQSVTTIWDYCFYYVQNVREIAIPSTVSSIGKYAFYRSKLEKIDMSSCGILENIPIYAFADCVYLSEVLFPNSIKLGSIGNYAFNNCVSLVNVELNDGVKTIGEYAFGNCIGLTAITLPDSITSLGRYFVNGDYSLTELILPATVKCNTYAVITSLGSLTAITLPIFSTDVEDGYDVYDSEGYFVSHYETLEEAQAAAAAISGTVETHMTEVVYNNNYYYAYIQGCSNLIEFRLNSRDNNRIAKVYDGCLYMSGGANLTRVPFGKQTIRFNDTITSIANYAFDGVVLINEVKMPDTVNSIGTNAFSSANVKKIILSKNVTSLGSSTFNGCGAEEIYITSSAFTNIGNLVFAGCRSTYKLVILSMNLPSFKTGNYNSFGLSGSTETYSNPIGAGVTSDKTLYVSFGMMSAYTSNNDWTTYLINNNTPGFDIAAYALNNNIYLKVYRNGVQVTDPDLTPYLVTTSKHIPGQLINSGIYVGYYMFALSDISNGEPMAFKETLDGDEYATIIPWYGTNKYEISYSKAILSSARLMASVYGTSEQQERTITVTEYNLLLAKVNQLTSQINELIKE